MGTALLMAIALSLDGFGVGLAYGMRRIHLPLGSLSVIMLCTALAMGSSMLMGTWLVSWLEFVPWRIVGAGIILGLGFFQLLRAVRHQGAGETMEAVPALATYRAVAEAEPVWRFQLRFLGLVVHVLRTPDLADIDGSGGISLRESLLLGLALAMDAFSTGIGAALAGITILVIVLVALVQVVMIRLGQRLAGRIPARLLSKAEFLPGMVLIAIGIGKLI